MFLFEKKEAVTQVENYTKLLGVTTPGGGAHDWHVIFTGNADGHADDGAVNANIELFVNGLVVPNYETYVELKLHWVESQAQPVGSPIGGLTLSYILTNVPALTTIDVFGQASAGVSPPFDTGGIDFFVMTLTAIKL